MENEFSSGLYFNSIKQFHRKVNHTKSPGFNRCVICTLTLIKVIAFFFVMQKKSEKKVYIYIAKPG